METAGIVMLIVQIAFAVHALRRGYPLFWVFLIVFVPLLGCVLYVALVLIPEAVQSRTARRGSKAFLEALDPGKELRKRREALEASDTVGNRAALAEEYVRQGMLDEAIRLYESSLTGLYRTDPELLRGLAAALAKAGQFDRVRSVLDTLYQSNPGFDHPEARLLRARALEELGDTEQALEEYSALLKASAGVEPKCRYALLLKRLGRLTEARALFDEILRDARLGNRHSQRLNQEWVAIAKKEL